MSYVLATTENTIRWYLFSAQAVVPGQFALVEVLTLDQVPQFADKTSAREAAIALGLRTWRYVKI